MKVEEHRGVTLMSTLYKVHRVVGGKSKGKEERKGNFTGESDGFWERVGNN